MFFADALNAKGLFQRIGGWIAAPNAEALHGRCNVVLQRAHQVTFHLDQCAHLENLALQQFQAHLKGERDLPPLIHGWSPLVSFVIIELSGALSALRILQNDVWAVATSAAGARNAPSSIRDAYNTFSRKLGTGNKPPRWVAEVPVEIRRLVTSYWETSGHLIASYRDVDQHHDVLARGAMLLIGDDHLRRVSVRLPDNPQDKSRAKFSYERAIDALDLARESLQALHDLVEDIATHFGAPTSPIQQQFDFAPAIHNEPGISAVRGITLFDTTGRHGILLSQNENMNVVLKQIAL